MNTWLVGRDTSGAKGAVGDGPEDAAAAEAHLLGSALAAAASASMAGAARGRQAGGRPDPLEGLTTPDVPGLSNESASMEDLVLPRGYPLESYPVETADGHVLRLYRIPHGAKNATRPGPRPAVLLHHGITCASSSFTCLDPESSMGFYLADAGFDVWLANTRGSTYSRGHRTRRDTDTAYWAFSMDELALVDLPAQIDFVLSTAGQPSLGLVGHSQGSTLPIMLLSSKPEYNSKVWLLTLLGAVTSVKDVAAPFLKQQAQTESARKFLAGAGVGGFIPSQVTSPALTGCKRSAHNLGWCLDLTNFAFFGPSKLTRAEDVPVILSIWPSGVSTRNLQHWSQMYHDRRLPPGGLRMFDFGQSCGMPSGGPVAYSETCNSAMYGQDEAPEYDQSNVTARVAIFEGELDLMAPPKAVDTMVSRLDGARHVYNKHFKGVAHMDFVWARNPPFKSELIRVLWTFAPKPAPPPAAAAPPPAAAAPPPGGRALLVAAAGAA
ncbi:lipase member J [Raphidocelis subcapitata]|uniref:Lipase member J n=1 Tax=Raphidocelis subcapitata TaxID=307507 RepID=A0A2V0P2D3_9CHLO|nr:lipase member J [Raphidocelis subcapitata]|eukprot:GBF94026.1 lipase member J [Raphidocelis subcapitata]